MKLFSIFGRKRVNPFAALEVRFHKEANLFGEHGTMVVTHVKQNLIEKPVRFVFVGLSTPPKLTLDLHTYLWEEARAQGYVPHELQTYGKEVNLIDTAKPVLVTQLSDVRPANAA